MKAHEFKKSVVVGDIGEEIFQNLLEKENIKYIKTEGRIYYDFLVNDIQIDVKYDVMSAKTQNLAFELKSSNSNEGWFASPKADIYVYIDSSDKDSAFIFTKEDIRQISSSIKNSPNFYVRLKVVSNGKFMSVIYAAPIKEYTQYRKNLVEFVKSLR